MSRDRVRELEAEIETLREERDVYREAAFRSEKLASLGCLAASVAHEVGNCLTGITGYCQLLTMDPEPEVYPFEELKLIEAEGRRAVRVMQSVLAMSRQSKLRDEAVDVGAALLRALELLRHYTAKRGVEVSNDIPEDTPFVHGDRTQIQQVLINLIKNATDAIEATGKRGRIVVASHSEGSWVHVRVADDGPGIPPELRETIFDPFFTTKEEGKGTGLGLSFSRDLAEAFQGKLRLDPNVREGACFILELRRWALEAEDDEDDSGEDPHASRDAARCAASAADASEAEAHAPPATADGPGRTTGGTRAQPSHPCSEPRAA